MSMPVSIETPLARVLAKFPGAKRQGSGFAARCPSHEDTKPSLSIGQGKDGRVVLTCHKGCPTRSIVGAVGLDMSDLFAKPSTTTYSPPINHEGKPARVAIYDYVDELGTLLYRVNRFEPGLDGGDKSFIPEHPDGTRGYPEGPRVLYKLPDVLDAIDNGRTVYLTEGEKCAETLGGEGYTVTCHAGGANSWREEYAQKLRGADVVILLDNDDKGRSWGEQAAASITSAGASSVRVVKLPGLPREGDDIVDWLDQGHDLDELERVVGNTPLWMPDPSKRTRWRLDELLTNDAIMRPPAPVVPRLAWASMSTLFAAREKAGKSTLMGKVAAAVSKGGRFLGDPCERGTVLIVGLEEFIGNAARRLREFDADPTRIFLVDKMPGAPKERLQAVREHIEAVSPVLVIVDTLMAYGRGQITDANNAAQMEPVVSGLSDLAHQTGVALLLVHHGKKADGAYRDSTAIGAGVDVIAEMHRPKDTEHTDPTRREIRVEGRVPVHGFAFRYVGGEYVLDTGDRAPLDQQIVAIVRDRPGCSSNDVAETVPGRKQEVLKLVDTMVNDGRLRDLGHSSRARKLIVPGNMLPVGMEP